MRVLQVVGGLPSIENPSLQPFVASQIESIRKQGVHLDVLDLSRLRKSGWFKYLKGIFLLRKMISASNYNLIHSHYSYCGWVSLFQSRLPVVVSLMGSDLLGSPDMKGCLTWGGRFDKCVTKLLSRYVDHIIVKSDEMAKEVLCETKVSVVPNGVDLELFKPVDREYARAYFHIEQNKKVILFAADPKNPIKNYLLADQAVQNLKERFGLECLLLPFRKHKQTEVPLAMSAADVLIITSFWEGSPNVVKEAMACNLPIVSVKVGDVSKIIEGTSNCYLADYESGNLAEKLALVIASNRRSDGREHIKNLSLENVAQRIVDIYKCVISSAGSQE